MFYHPCNVTRQIDSIPCFSVNFVDNLLWITHENRWMWSIWWYERIFKTVIALMYQGLRLFLTFSSYFIQKFKFISVMSFLFDLYVHYVR